MLTISVADRECAVTVDIAGGSGRSQWYDLWADAVAITGVCVIRGYWGFSNIQGTLTAYTHEQVR